LNRYLIFFFSLFLSRYQHRRFAGNFQQLPNGWCVGMHAQKGVFYYKKPPRQQRRQRRQQQCKSSAAGNAVADADNVTVVDNTNDDAVAASSSPSTPTTQMRRLSVGSSPDTSNSGSGTPIDTAVATAAGDRNTVADDDDAEDDIDANNSGFNDEDSGDDSGDDDTDIAATHRQWTHPRDALPYGWRITVGDDGAKTFRYCHDNDIGGDARSILAACSGSSGGGDDVNNNDVGVGGDNATATSLDPRRQFAFLLTFTLGEGSGGAGGSGKERGIRVASGATIIAVNESSNNDSKSKQNDGNKAGGSKNGNRSRSGRGGNRAPATTLSSTLTPRPPKQGRQQRSGGGAPRGRTPPTSTPSTAAASATAKSKFGKTWSAGTAASDSGGDADEKNIVDGNGECVVKEEGNATAAEFAITVFPAPRDGRASFSPLVYTHGWFRNGVQNFASVICYGGLLYVIYFCDSLL
jgi:hypothetical protein